MSVIRGSLLTRNWVKAVLVSVSFFVLGVGWAFASPHGSSADDDFHLTSIWCSQGYSEYCQDPGDEVGALVPRIIAYPACYVKWPATESARCSKNLTYELIYTTRKNPESGGRPSGFHRAMGTFAGKDVVSSVQAMRIANVALASVLLGLVLFLVSPSVQRAVALSWGVGVLPVGVFFIASTNPSSWLIIAMGLYWALMYSVLTDNRNYDLRFWSRIAILGFCFALALSARRDAGIYILIASLAVGILVLGRKKKVHKRLLVALAIVAAVATWFFWQAFSGLLSVKEIPGAQTATDQPNPVIKTALELPSFFLALLGGQQPLFAISDSGFRQGIHGYRPTGFSYGLGWADFSLPSAVGLLGLAAVVVAITCGFNRYSRRRIWSLLVVVSAVLTQIFVMRIVDDFGSGWLIQPRFFIPYLLLALGISLLTEGEKGPMFNRFQALLLFVCVVLAGSLAWLGTAGRYALGPDAAFTNFGQTADWWWEIGPSRLVWFLIIVLATMLWARATLWSYGTQPMKAGGIRKEIEGSHAR